MKKGERRYLMAFLSFLSMLSPSCSNDHGNKTPVEKITVRTQSHYHRHEHNNVQKQA